MKRKAQIRPGLQEAGFSIEKRGWGDESLSLSVFSKGSRIDGKDDPETSAGCEVI